MIELSERDRRLLLIVAVAASVSAVATVGTIAATWRVVRPADWVNVKSLDHACRADAHAAECIVTNTKGEPVKTCFHVRFQRKGGSADRVSSVNMCPGRLEPFESKTVRAPWGESVEKACSSSKGLDWEACDMQIEAGGY